MPPLRIVHVIVAPGRGGAEAMALDLSRAQRRAGHLPSFLLLSESDYRADVDAAGFPVIVAHVPSPADARATWRAADALIGLSPDVVHCHGTRAILVAACARARRCRVAIVSTTHGNPSWVDPGGITAIRERCSRLLARAAVDGIAGVNLDLARADRERFPSIPVVEIVNGVDTDIFHPATAAERRRQRTTLGFGDGDGLVVCTSRLTPLKGVDVLLDAWAGVHVARPNAILAIVGDGSERERLQRDGHERFGSSVRFVGSVHDVAAMLRAADVFVFPSIRGCFGRSAIEALASGLPVIASRLDGTERFVTDRETARLCAPGDSRALSLAIASLLEDRTLSDRLGSAGRQLAERRFSLEAMARAYEALYADARSHASGRRPSSPR